MSESVENLDRLQQSVLSTVLQHVPFDGWSETVMRRAADELEISAADLAQAFPDGLPGLMSFFGAEADKAMLEAATAADLPSLKIRERITKLVRLRIEAVMPYREAERRAVTWAALPFNGAVSMRILARTVDLMWRAAGDTSTDFNFYSKRTILAGVYSSTLIYWLNDDSEDYADTWAFLDRRIENVMQFEKVKGRMRQARERLPDPIDVLRRLRYPQDRRMRS